MLRIPLNVVNHHLLTIVIIVTIVISVTVVIIIVVRLVIIVSMFECGEGGGPAKRILGVRIKFQI